MTVHTVAMPKGGATKSTTAAELVAYLADQGQRVLAIDLDQQGNLSTRLGIVGATEVDAVAADVLTGEADADAAVASPSLDGVWVLPGTHDLAEVEQRPEVLTSLRDHLPQATGWDAVVIDTPPHIGMATLAGLAAADVVVAPLTCATEDLDQVARLEAVITERIARRVRPGQRIDWIVPSRHNARRLLDQEVVEELERTWPGRVTRPIREAVAVRDAFTAGLPVSRHAPGAPVSSDYREAMQKITSKN